MVSKKKITISWSGGKDSAFALYKVLLSGDYEVSGLHTVINSGTRRVGMHGVRESLMDRQAEGLGLPLTKLYLESAETHAAYQELMSSYYKRCAEQNIDAVVFGDIFLADLKQFRLDLLKPSGLKAIFPLWQTDTGMLIGDFVNAGFKTIICAADAGLFSQKQIGQTIDHKFVSSLKKGIDPCGENGEFHTFVYDGPLFNKPLTITKGEIVKKIYSFRRVNDEGRTETVESAFWFQDLLP